MWCINCGKEIPDDTKFCLFCGADQTTESIHTAQAEPSAGKPSSKKIIAIIAAIVVFLCAAGGGAYFTFFKKTAADLYAYQDSKTGLWGYVDKSGKQIIKPKFSKALDFNEKSAAVCDKDSGLWGYIDCDGDYIIEPEFVEAYKFNDSIAPVCNSKKKWGYIGTDGEYIIEPEFKDVYQFEGKYAPVCDEDDLWGYIDKKGEFVVLPQYSFAGVFSEGYALVCDETSKLYGYIDEEWNYVIEPQFTDALAFSESKAAVCDSSTGLWGYIDESGEYVIDPSWERAYSFSAGYAAVKDGDSGLYGYIDSSGEVIISPQFKSAGTFSEGYAAVFDKETELWGYIDGSGDFVIEPQFKKAHPFADGIAMVIKKDDTCDYIDSEGLSIIKKEDNDTDGDKADNEQTNGDAGTNTEADYYPLVVDSYCSYDDTLGPYIFDYGNGDTSEYYCEVNINVPKVSDKTVGYEEMNAMIFERLKYQIDIYEDLENGDVSRITDDCIAAIISDYDLYEYNNTTSLIVESGAAAAFTGGSPNYLAIYYDNSTGELLDMEEYARLNGYSLDDIVLEYELQDEYDIISEYNTDILKNGSVTFYFTEDGSLEFRESFL